MRLLIITQTLDPQDSQLGFFTSWVEALANEQGVEDVQVICLKRGEYTPPPAVETFSLGKEHGAQSRWIYGYRFMRTLLGREGTYSHVFVHMNQDYVLLAGLWWRLRGIPVALWRNHYAGSLFTDIAVKLSNVVFCTSQDSYTAQFEKTTFMPVGVSVERFPLSTAPRDPRIICVGRLSSSKHNKELIEAFAQIYKKDSSLRLDFVGAVDPGQEEYAEALHDSVAELGLTEAVVFHGPVPHEKLVGLLHKARLAINIGAPGMFDKTIVEAMAAGTPVVARNADIHSLLDPRLRLSTISSEALAALLLDVALDEVFLSREGVRQSREAIKHHSLSSLVGSIVEKLSSI